MKLKLEDEIFRSRASHQLCHLNDAAGDLPAKTLNRKNLLPLKLAGDPSRKVVAKK